jgi:F420-dependent oxidoreductase-like protein
VSFSLGIDFWPQNCSWDDLRDYGVMADHLGYDSLWTWDHFLPIIGSPEGPNFEGWQVLAAWAALTSRVKIGMMVTSITYRHPAVIAKMSAALDHISNGRAVAGLGAGWFELEHKQYGLEFGTAGQRLAKLAEGAAIVRSLLDNETTDFSGKYYQLEKARAEPKPIQKRLPIMIGGGGEKKTLRITAEYADMWNGLGTPEIAAHKIKVLENHCADVGRDPSSIHTTILTAVTVRDRHEDILARTREIERVHQTPESEPRGVYGTVEEVAQQLAAYHRVGVNGIIAGIAPPFDRETVERLATEVRPRVLQLIGEA